MIKDVPLRQAYVEAQAGLVTGAPYAQVEAGARLKAGLGVYGLAKWQPSGWVTAVGTRWQWDF